MPVDLFSFFSNPVTLLLKFFKFYSEQFDFSKHVVSIHAHMLTRDGAVEKIIGVGREPAMRYFYRVPLVVQDPFDLEHNVSKLVNRSVFVRLQAGFKNSHALLERELEKDSQASILAILDHPPDDGRESGVHSRQLDFSPSDVRNLLLQRGVTLKDRLGELGLPETRPGLEQLVLREVVGVLSSKFMFEESSAVTPEGGAPGEEWREEEEVEDIETSNGGTMGKEEERAVVLRERGEEEMDRSAEEIAMGEERDDSGEGGREGGDGEEGGGGMESSDGGMECGGSGVEAMEVEGLLTEEGGVVSGDGELVKRKRLLSEQDRPEGILFHKKHCKFSELRTLGNTWPHPHSYVCTAYRNTWTGTRRARRQLLHSPQGMHSQATPSLQGSMSPSDSTGGVQQPHPEVVPLTVPLLQLHITLEPLPLDSWQQESVCINIALLQGSKGDFYKFLVVLKKALFS